MQRLRTRASLTPLLAALAACAGAGTATPSVPAGGGARTDGAPVRTVDPFPVVGADGQPYALPFLGGFNVPRPQWVDLDADGDLDLVIQEYTGRLMAFEHTPGAGDEPRWTWRPEALSDVDVGEWYRFVDIDADGDPDLLGEEPFSHIRLYRNTGRGNAFGPAFELAADTLRDDRGQPVFSDRQNIPNAADFDCDAHLDLLIGRTVGTVSHYEAVVPLGPEVPRFALRSDEFEGIEIVGQTGPQLPGGGGAPAGGVTPGPGAPTGPGAPMELGQRGSRHGANTMALADHDADGDLDLFWGDFFEPGLLLIENVGGCEAPRFPPPYVPFPVAAPLRTSGYNAPSFGDVDGDGDLDLLVGVLGGAFNANATTVGNLLFYERTGAGWTLRTPRYIGQLDVGAESIPSLVDLEGDGDLDLVVGNKIDPADPEDSGLTIFENVGGPRAPSFRERGTLDLGNGYHKAPAFADLDDDGDVDLLLGTFQDALELYLNEAGPGAQPRFVRADSALVRLTRGSNATPALGDLDGDGDADLLVGESSGALNYYRNVGTAQRPAFELVSDEYAGVDAERRSTPHLVDLDGDGDLDLLVGTERRGVLVWRNDGGRAEPRFVPAEPLLGPEDAPALGAPVAGDLDGDGRLELLVGGLGGGLFHFRTNAGP